jgi:hypothetical protein
MDSQEVKSQLEKAFSDHVYNKWGTSYVSEQEFKKEKSAFSAGWHACYALNQVLWNANSAKSSCLKFHDIEGPESLNEVPLNIVLFCRGRFHETYHLLVLRSISTRTGTDEKCLMFLDGTPASNLWCLLKDWASTEIINF